MIETFEWLRGISARWDLANSGVWPLDYREYLAEPGVDLADAVSQTYGADRGSIALTSGAQEGNFLALWALRKKARRAVVFLPEYEPIYRLPSELGYETATASGDPLQRVEGGAVILLSNPNNPTGRYLDVRRLRELADEARRRGSYLVVDAIFADFVDDPRGLPEEAAVFNFSTDKFFTSSVRVGWSLGTGRSSGPWRRPRTSSTRAPRSSRRGPATDSSQGGPRSRGGTRPGYRRTGPR
ncbi:MAG: aminotransferase class I/II-fold pyridoxal phosphate-dependent enzyme [Thermoproteus sp.]